MAVIFILLPIVGLLWFLNLLNYMERLHKDQNTHNQKVLGGFYTVVFIALALYIGAMMVG